MTDSGPNDTPPGWYPDHEHHGGERWWDGRGWTEHRRPRPVNASPNPPAATRGNADVTSSRAPKAHTGRNPLAVVAVIAAVTALLLGFVPFAGFVTWTLAAAAVALAVVAITRGGRRKGFALTGLIVGAIAFFVGPAVAIGSVIAVSQSATPQGAAASLTPAPAQSSVAPPLTVPSAGLSPMATTPVTANSVSRFWHGTGDDVVHVNYVDPVVVTFTCAHCTDNTVLTTDSGDNTLLVNTVGPYYGRHLVNTGDGDLLTKFAITANAKWKLTVTPTVDAVHLRLDTVGQEVTGTGDDIVYVGTDIGDLMIVNHAGPDAGNFVVQAYGDHVADPLVVNEIGSYSGTDPLLGPALVQVQSDGQWTITGEN